MWPASGYANEKGGFVKRILTLGLTLLALMVAFSNIGYAQTANKIRVMHASPNAPAVDVYVDGNLVLADVPFFATSPYLELPDGTYNIAVTPAGASTDNAVLSGPLTVQGGAAGTVAAVNTLDNIEAVLYEDNLATPEGGLARVNVIHAVPDAPAVDIRVAGTDNVVFSNVSFKQSGVIEVPAGTYAFDITPAGSSTVLFTTPDLRFEAGWIYTLVATGQLDSNFWVQSVVDQIAQ